MAGYTDVAFRALCRRFGCALTYTEVVNATGIVHRNGRTLDMLEIESVERPVAAHIYGSEPSTMAEAARYIEQLGRFDVIDVNCGCPVRKIVAKGAGAALMREPEKIGRIVRAIRDAVSLPVTVKTRVGLKPDSINILETAQAVEEAGAAAIAVHARPASQVHSGPADWDALARVKAARRLSVIGNGGVSAPEDVLRMFRETGVDGVMVGRAAVGNPWFFEQARALLGGVAPRLPGTDERRAMVLEHLGRLMAMKQQAAKRRRKRGLPPDQTAVLTFRAHLHRYLAGFPRWPEVRRTLNTMHTEEHVLNALWTVLGGTEGREGQLSLSPHA
jgi:nifR3 family TIM-barrel protein